MTLVELSEHFVDAEVFSGVVCRRFAKFLEIAGIFDLFKMAVRAKSETVTPSNCANLRTSAAS